MDGVNADSRIHATVTALEYLGAEALVSCRIGERSMLARTRGDCAPPVGAEVSLVWDNSAGHVFDAASGARLAIDTGSQSAQRRTTININQGSTFA